MTKTTLNHFIKDTKPEIEPIINALTKSSITISEALRHPDGLLGKSGNKNSYGDDMKKIDELADQTLMRNMFDSGAVAKYYSEENAEAVVHSPDAKYNFFTDPLDGSGNIDIGLGVATIFSVSKNDGRDLKPTKELEMVGYVLYGTRITLVITFPGSPVAEFTLNPTTKEFELINNNVRTPNNNNKNFGLNMGRYNIYSKRLQNYIHKISESGKINCRNVACMVHDMHRFLHEGGVFIKPEVPGAPDGKLRLVYEVAPMSMIIHNAGGAAITTTDNTNIMDITPNTHDQLSTIIAGSTDMVELYKNTK